METVKFEKLPGIPRTWLDFLESKLPVVPGKIGDLVSRAESIRRASGNGLIPAGAIAVVANVYAALFGGPVAQFLKCLTASRLCDELKKENINAVPVCWIQPDPPPGFERLSANLIDDNAEIRSVELAPEGNIVEARIAGLISEIRDLGHGAYDPATLDLMESTFFPGASISSASARFISELMGNCGIVVVDPASKESQVPAPGAATAFPVLAQVLDPHEISSVISMLPEFERAGISAPAYWPSASVTVGDAKSRRTLSRYNLSLVQLYSGDSELLRVILEALPRGAEEKLRAISAETANRMAELKPLLPAGSEVERTAESCTGKILYQIEKLKHHLEASWKAKEQTAGRQIRRAVNMLAPGRELQERKIAGVQIPLSYSREGLRRLYESLEIHKFEHQLIWMD